MQVVARQQNDVAGSKHEVLSILAVDPDTEFTLDDVVIKNQVRCWPESGARNVLARRGRPYTKARRNRRAKKTPPVKCATLKTSDNASIPTFLSEAGVSVMSQGEPVIDPLPSDNLKIAASADRFVCAIGALLRERRLK